MDGDAEQERERESQRLLYLATCRRLSEECPPLVDQWRLAMPPSLPADTSYVCLKPV